MASVEDQADEDFFDKLVGDEIEVGSDPVLEGTEDNVGVDRGLPVLGSEEVSRGEECCPDSTILPSESAEKDSLVREENVSSLPSVSGEEVCSSEQNVEVPAETGFSESSVVGKSSKGTNVKVVQWSAFGGGTEQPELDVFDSFSDFPAEISGESSERAALIPDNQASVLEYPSIDYSGASAIDQQGGQVQELYEQTANLSFSEQEHSQQTLDENDPKYWESLYPGWKYDYNTGQWYQLDSYDSASGAHSDNHGTTALDAPESSQDGKLKLAGNEAFLEQKAEVSYVQQDSQYMVQTVTESLMDSTISNLNQEVQGQTEYPSNMVFDPQYPGWYYDLNTQQWYSLESYYQYGQSTASNVHNQVLSGENDTSNGYFVKQNSNFYDNKSSQLTDHALYSQTNSAMDRELSSTQNQPQANVWQMDSTVSANINGSSTAFTGHQPMGNARDLTGTAKNHFIPRGESNTTNSVSEQSYGQNNGVAMFQTFIPSKNTFEFNQPKVEHNQQTSQGYFGNQNTYQFDQTSIMQNQLANIPQSYYSNQHSINYSQQPFQHVNAPLSESSYAPMEERSSAGRPPHALVTFGFGGKLVVVKDTGANFAIGSQGSSGGIISVLDLMDVVTPKADSSSSSSAVQSHGYFHTLCNQSFPGPLVGGNAASKDISKWIDERISSCESSYPNFREGELLRILLSLLKLSYQHYGKLRSPYGSDAALQEKGGPECDVTKLFSSARKNGAQLRENGTFTSCMHNLPSEGQLQATAVEVQNLLVSGKRKEALECAQEGLLWGPALVLASQLGEKFYVDTVKQMAHHQFVFGSPLRTLCLLISGQLGDVFSTHSPIDLSGGANASSQGIANAMLDDWEENLAIITANRTKDDELVAIHLGDCLWKERGEITAAHTCYLVAESNFEQYSDKARLCLIGADHWKNPRTYASPEAIQRTEFYECSKVLGNSQFVLLAIQPYKLFYAYMLAEVGKVSESLRYCQAIAKLLKNSSRAPEVETWKVLASSLEERLRAHQQGGYGANLAPGKLVGKFFTTIDKSISRMIGSPPSGSMSLNTAQNNEYDSFPATSKVTNSQSTMTMSSLMPSASMETVSEWKGDNRKTMHSRSASEPNFARSTKEAQTSPASDTQGKISSSGGSRFGRFGSQLFQKTMGWVARSSDRQAKLGEKNKFYYDEKLKRWVEEGAEPPVEEAALKPPPTMSSFQNGTSESNSKNQTLSANMVAKPSTSVERSPGIPPIPPGQNQFSARGRLGVRARYVDTFNKGGVSASSFKSPLVPSLKPVGTSNFFVPSPIPTVGSIGNATESAADIPNSVGEVDAPFPVPSSSHSLQRYTSMDFTTPTKTGAGLGGQGSSMTHSRAASWAGGFSDFSNLSSPEAIPFLDDSRTPSSLEQSIPLPCQTSVSLRLNGSSSGEDLHEVEL